MLARTQVQGHCHRRFASSEIIDVSNSWVCDAGLQTPIVFTALNYLNLSYCAVSGAGLNNLKLPTGRRSAVHDNRPFTQTVNLSGTLISDDDLAVVAEWEGLTELSLVNTNIDGSGLKHLAKLTLLKSLDLLGTKITKESLKELRSFPAIQELKVDLPLLDAANEVLRGKKPSVFVLPQ